MTSDLNLIDLDGCYLSSFLILKKNFDFFYTFHINDNYSYMSQEI